MTSEEKVATVLRIAQEKGVKIHEPDHSIDLDEPLLGRDAVEILQDLEGHNGRFATIQGITPESVVELARHGTPSISLSDEEVEEVADGLDLAGEKTFEAPDNYDAVCGETPRRTFPVLVFNFD